MPGPFCIGQMPTGLADRGGDNAVYQACLGSDDCIFTEGQGGLTADECGFADPGWQREFVVGSEYDFGSHVSRDLFVRHATPEGFNFSPVSGVAELLVHAEDDKLGGSANMGISQGLDNDLRTNASWVSHGDANHRLLFDFR